MSRSSASVEREVKLSAWPGFQLPSLADVRPDITAGTSTSRLLDAVYWDAADLRLVRSGVTVRHRVGEGPAEGIWTVKLPRPASGDVLERTEIEGRGSGDQPPPRVLAIVRGLLRGAPLVRVSRLQTRRLEVELRDGDGRLTATVADDEVSVLVTADRIAARFRLLEVELGPSATQQVTDAIVERLRAAGAGEPDPTPKLVRALGPRALAPPEPTVPVLRGDPTVGDVARAALAGSVRKLLAVDVVLRTEPNEKSVHDARVATRRLRADLRTFGPALEPGWAAPLTEELAWLGGVLGAVRDLDVLGLRLAALVDELEPADRPAASALIAHLTPQRERALGQLADGLDGDRYVALLERLVRAAERPAFTGLASTLAREAGVALAGGTWRKLHRSADAIEDGSPVEDLHRLRIRAKRMRYAADAFAPVLPVAARQARELAALQEVLGGLNDATTGEAWLRATVAAGVPADQAVAAGVLIAAEQQQARTARSSWPTVWARVSGKKVRSWLRS